MSGCGYPKCGGRVKSTKEEFVKKSRLKHGDKYNYDQVDYIKCDTHVKIICKVEEHAEFLQIPSSHLSGRGCHKCGEI